MSNDQEYRPETQINELEPPSDEDNDKVYPVSPEEIYQRGREQVVDQTVNCDLIANRDKSECQRKPASDQADKSSQITMVVLGSILILLLIAMVGFYFKKARKLQQAQDQMTEEQKDYDRFNELKNME